MAKSDETLKGDLCMEHCKKGSIIQVSTIDGGCFVLTKDLKTKDYRWVSLEYGTITKESYESVEAALDHFRGMDAVARYHSFIS